MREILFRGKRTDNDDWVYGYYVHIGPVSCQRAYIIPEYASSLYVNEVDPSTVGQYTGLNDKNGKRIFEGDIVDGHCHSAWSHRLQRCDIAYGRDGFEARNHIDGVDSDYYTYRVLFSKDVVIIGNIHDNPELLEK